MSGDDNEDYHPDLDQYGERTVLRLAPQPFRESELNQVSVWMSSLSRLGVAETGSGYTADSDLPTFGELLRILRREINFSQVALARAAYFSVDYVRRLEKDRRRPPLATVEILAHALGLQPDQKEALRAAAARGARNNWDTEES